MGCCASRKETELKIEETVLIPFETSLGLKDIPYSKLYPKLKELSDKGYISYYEISKIFADSKLPFQEIFEFYNQFDRTKSRVITDKKFSYLQLQSFFLVTCKGDTKSKVKDWLELYDDGKKSVVTTRVEEMIENLLKVSIDYICDFSSKMNSENPVMAKYSRLVKVGKDSLTEDLSRRVRSNKNIISASEFISNCTSPQMIDLFSSMQLRDRAYYFGINGGMVISESLLDAKSRLQPLSFDDLSDLSSEFDRESRPSPPTISKKSSIFSNESAAKKENFRYSPKADKRFSILVSGNDGDSEHLDNLYKKSPKNMGNRDSGMNSMLGVLPSGNNNARRGSHCLIPPGLSIGKINGKDGKLGKRFSIVVTSTET